MSLDSYIALVELKAAARRSMEVYLNRDCPLGVKQDWLRDQGFPDEVIQSVNPSCDWCGEDFTPPVCCGDCGFQGCGCCLGLFRDGSGTNLCESCVDERKRVKAERREAEGY